MNTSFAPRLRPMLLTAVSVFALLSIGSAARAQSNSTPLDPILADASSVRVEVASQPTPTRSRLPEAPVGLAHHASALVTEGEVRTVVVTGITGVEQRLWVPDGMELYEETVEVRDGNGDGIPEVTAAGVREGRVGLCTWSYRPALERYSSRAQIDFEIEQNSDEINEP